LWEHLFNSPEESSGPYSLAAQDARLSPSLLALAEGFLALRSAEEDPSLDSLALVAMVEVALSDAGVGDGKPSPIQTSQPL